jgi:hypothetical protein
MNFLYAENVCTWFLMARGGLVEGFMARRINNFLKAL